MNSREIRDLIASELNPEDYPDNLDVSIQPISTQGYSEGDLSSYYSGTVVLQCVPERGFEPVMVEHAIGREYARVIAFTDDWQNKAQNERYQTTEVKFEDLYRFVPECGYYILPRWNARTSGDVSGLYRLTCNVGGYKKSFGRNNFRMQTAEEDPRLGDRMHGVGALEVAKYILNPVPMHNRLRVLSRRLAINKRGELLTSVGNYVVGNVQDNKIKTCFPCIVDRVQELLSETGEYECQIVDKPVAG